jgi:hypothetical protein
VVVHVATCSRHGVNAAADLLAADVSAADAARELADRFGCSLRQAHRYLQHAGPSGHVPVPDPLGPGLSCQVGLTGC